MSKKLFTILPAALLAGLFSMNVQAHSGDGAHVVVSSSGPVKSSSGCVTSSGTGAGAGGCGGEVAMAAPAAAAPVAEAPAMAAPAAAAPAKAMGSAHSHAANHCTNSMVHTHAAPGGHKHSYSCKMAKPRQMAQ